MSTRKNNQQEQKIENIIQVLQNVALGDFSSDIKIEDNEDKFTELAVAINLMIDDLREYKNEMDKKVTQQTKQLKQREENYRKLFETSKDAIMTLEPPTWGFTSGNPATIKIFGVKNEKEFVSLGPGDLSPEKQSDGQLTADKAKEMIGKAMKEGSNFFEWTHKKYKGKSFLATVLLTRVQIKDKQFLQATVRDISEQNEKLEELEKMNKLMVGRELKMVELKKKIQKFEKKKKYEKR